MTPATPGLKPSKSEWIENPGVTGALAIGIGAVLTWLFVRNRIGRVNVVSEKDNGGSVTIKAGERLTVTLGAIPSTGFNWNLISGFPGIEPVKTRAQLGIRPGQGVFESWTWTPRSTGQYPIRFEYKRPWETGVPPVKTFSIDVTVLP